MICPWLKTTRQRKAQVSGVTYEEYGECYEDECPWYGFREDGTFNDEPECLRVRAEYNKAKGGDNHDD